MRPDPAFLAPPLAPARAEALAALHAEAFAGRDRAWSAAEIAALTAAPGAALTAAGDPPLAFALARVVADEAELLTLAVAVAARRRGLAAALLDAVEAWARRTGAQTLLLEVAQDNTAAQALYAGRSYSEVGRRRGYYGSGPARADALTLRLAL